ncbi:NUDIX hydrolase [Alkalibacillus haloalkaliphilus]|uniref:NUDIX hydrolase n=1 Tax=Alkalibacillus haloalkaliphilus TaxID=94136 RepID=UPI002936907F|nr:NUDIX hydrolase [Alkalibacillus haloalkaliphilus]MDV2581786.1 NUDIX hydrolase [Alkalibacillus haloalkaliphilus]
MSFPTHIVACGGIVEDKKENILLVKEHHGGWVFPGGQVEIGENLEDGVIREVKEESGIDVVVSHLVGVYSNTGVHKWHDGVTDVPTKVMFDFVCEPIGGELTTSDETTDSRWVPKNDVLDWIETSAIRTRYQSYLDGERVKYMDYLTRPNFEVKRDREI